MICGVESTLAAADDGELDFPAEQQAGEGEGNRGGSTGSEGVSAVRLKLLIAAL